MDIFQQLTTDWTSIKYKDVLFQNFMKKVIFLMILKGVVLLMVHVLVLLKIIMF